MHLNLNKELRNSKFINFCNKVNYGNHKKRKFCIWLYLTDMNDVKNLTLCHKALN